MHSDANNPYASPTIPAENVGPALPALSSDEVRRKLAIPAFGLIAAGVVGVFVGLAFVVGIVLDSGPKPSLTGMGVAFDKVLFTVFSCLLFGGFGFVSVHGGLAMRQVRSCSAARWAGIVGVAALGGPFLLGFPFAVWTLILLRDERIRGAFRSEPVRWLPRR